MIADRRCLRKRENLAIVSAAAEAAKTTEVAPVTEVAPAVSSAQDVEMAVPESNVTGLSVDQRTDISVGTTGDNTSGISDHTSNVDEKEGARGLDIYPDEMISALTKVASQVPRTRPLFVLRTRLPRNKICVFSIMRWYDTYDMACML